jgi:hypothetical protein
MSGLDLNFAVVGIVTVNDVRPAGHVHVLTELCDTQTVRLNNSIEFCFMFSSFL